MTEEKYDDGWVDPVPCNDWTLFDAAMEIENEAYRRAAHQLEREWDQNRGRFEELVRYYKQEMWALAQRLLSAEYKIIDLEQFSYHLQYYGIDGPEDPDDPNQYEEPEVIPDHDFELISEGEEETSHDAESIPTAEEIQDWLSD